MTTDPELHWHVTASWSDVRQKARRIRSEGGVRVIVANADRVVAHVRGDAEVYETEINRVPGRRQVAHWACACAWAAYSWGRTGRWRRFEGRMCSHALATQYEAQARGMFGREVQVDTAQPHWLDPSLLRQPGSYDRDTGKHSALEGAGAADFTGMVDGRVVPLSVHPEHGVIGPAGAVEPATVTHPDYHPDLGLVLSRLDSPNWSDGDEDIPYVAAGLDPPHLVEGAVDEAQEYPTHAGLVLKARDTGRILMLQRSLEDENDAAAGRWEFPGGRLEPGDHNTLHGALREWAEEVGQKVPPGVVAHTWTSPNGIYQGHVMVVPSEQSLILRDGRVVPNPDDPHGDHHEQAAWWDPDHARRNPALREEVKESPWKEIKMASALLPNEPGLDEFGDLPADENGVDADPDHALPVTYGDDEHAAALVTAELMRRTAAKAGARAFTPAEQQQVIDEGVDVRAANLDRLDLAGTHYALVPDTGDDETWGW
jgi:8-oxo-dGTP pyrophosphatase MutT (NUDIX family)